MTARKSNMKSCPGCGVEVPTGRQIYCTQTCRERTKKRRQRQIQRVESAADLGAVRRASKSDLKAVAKEAAQEVARETERAFVQQDAQLWTLLEEYREANDRLYANLTDLKKEATARMRGLQNDAMLLAVLLQRARFDKHSRMTPEQYALFINYLNMAKKQMGSK